MMKCRPSPANRGCCASTWWKPRTWSPRTTSWGAWWKGRATPTWRSGWLASPTGATPSKKISTPSGMNSTRFARRSEKFGSVWCNRLRQFSPLVPWCRSFWRSYQGRRSSLSCLTRTSIRTTSSAGSSSTLLFFFTHEWLFMVTFYDKLFTARVVGIAP